MLISQKIFDIHWFWLSLLVDRLAPRIFSHIRLTIKCLINEGVVQAVALIDILEEVKLCRCVT